MVRGPTPGHLHSGVTSDSHVPPMGVAGLQDSASGSMTVAGPYGPATPPPISQEPSAEVVQAPLLGTNRHRSSVHIAL